MRRGMNLTQSIAKSTVLQIAIDGLRVPVCDTRFGETEKTVCFRVHHCFIDIDKSMTQAVARRARADGG